MSAANCTTCSWSVADHRESAVDDAIDAHLTRHFGHVIVQPREFSPVGGGTTAPQQH